MAVHRPFGDESEGAHLQSGAFEGRAIMMGPPPITYSRHLLDRAKTLATQGEFGLAVILAHTACEVAVERVIAAQLQSRKIEAQLGEAIAGFLNGYALTDNRARKLYTALTGDNLQQAPFWQRYQESVGRRNRAVHRGAPMERTDAEESLSVATDFISHLKQ